MKNSSIFDYNSDDVRSGSVDISTADALPAEQKKKNRAAGRIIYIVCVIAASICLAAIFLSTMIDRVNNGLIMELQAGEINPAAMEDGTYQGTHSSGDMSAAVTVEIYSGYIMDISLNSFKGIDTARAQRVFDAVIASQSLDTDGDEIGSEPSDIILLLAIENALTGSTVQ